MDDPIGLVLVFGGLFAIVCSVCDFEWFMGSRKARGLVNLLGRTGARILYCILGAVILVIGALIAFGVIESGR